MKNNIEKKMAKSIKKIAKAAKKNPIGTFGAGAAAGAVMATCVGFLAEKVAGKVVCAIRSKRSEKKTEEE